MKIYIVYYEDVYSNKHNYQDWKIDLFAKRKSIFFPNWPKNLPSKGNTVKMELYIFLSVYTFISMYIEFDIIDAFVTMKVIPTAGKRSIIR